MPVDLQLFNSDNMADGHGDLFSKCASKLLPRESNAPIPAKRRPEADINALSHDKESLQGLSEDEISGLTKVP
jgi:hypothetical protein